MHISDLFTKKIDRNIKGVITIGQEQEEERTQELSEYVVTRELNKHFHDFYGALTNAMDAPTDRMGVWISGFFGSGKSHFLKILSYLIENKPVKGKEPLDFFKDKIEDPILYSDMCRVGQDGSRDVIIFNIDSKSASDNKTNKQAIVDVFNKVFNEKLGYCGEIHWLAEMERHMEKKGTYSAFKEAYQQISGQPWEEGRDTFYFDRETIIDAFKQSHACSLETATKWFDEGAYGLSLSIEKFCKKVKEYCDHQGPHHRIFFLIDEMGQYIGDHTDLMLNLQTVTEDMGKALRGRAWIIVTSQESIDTITKERIRGNDFSKIMGRFATRLSLSSANTDEVIKKRLLAKTSVAGDTLRAFYGEKSAILKNLLSFSAQTAEMKTFSSPEEFIDIYPFIPYQFNLMQKVFEQVRLMGATGKHLSEGERSMLSAFQYAGIQYGKKEIGCLVPFHIFYNSIESFLDSSIRRVFAKAEENSRLHAFDIDVLKILFMIKHVKEMRPNLENLTTLLLDHADADKIELRSHIIASLERLRVETLIEKIGDEFTFLTNEEQDVNQQIKQVEIDETEIIGPMLVFIFEDIYRESSFKYDKNRSFQFNKKVDNQTKGTQSHELSLWILTPYHELYDLDPQVMMAKTIEFNNTILLKLPDDRGVLEEIRVLKKTEKYLRQRNSLTNSETIKKILNEKQLDCDRAKSRILQTLGDAIPQSEIFISGLKADCKGATAKEILNDALRLLVNDVYRCYSYIDRPFPTQKEIQALLQSNDTQQETFFIANPNRLALAEVERHLGAENSMNHKVTLKTLRTHFIRAPYGWGEMDISGLVAQLLMTKKIIARLSEEVLERTHPALLDALTNVRQAEKLVIAPREEIGSLLKDTVKKIIKDFTGNSSFPTDDDAFLGKIAGLLETQRQELETLSQYYQRRAYPGQPMVQRGVVLLNALVEKKTHPKTFFEQICQKKDDLLELAEDIQPVKGFFHSQVDIFDQAEDQQKVFESNKHFLQDESNTKLGQIKAILQSPTPFGQIKDLPALLDAVNQDFQTRLSEEKENIRSIMQTQREAVQQTLESRQVDETNIAEVMRAFDRFAETLDQCKDCNEVAGLEKSLNALIEKLLKITGSSTSPAEEPPVPIKPIKLIDLVPGNRSLRNQDDLNGFLDQLRTHLQKILDENMEINLY